MNDSSSISSSRSVVSAVERGRKLGIQVENPFTLKVGQVFTGFGIGCGVGIGVGRPLNLGAIPMLQQVTTAARGATDAFSGVGRHVNTSLRRLGAKNIEAGIGCGVGFGHGFGVGLAIKPGVIHQLQSCIGQALAKLMLKFGTVPGSTVAQNMVPDSVKSRMSMVNETEMQNPLKNAFQLGLSTQEHTSQGVFTSGSSVVGSTYKSFASKESPMDSPFGSRTEKVISSFLQSPVLKDEGDLVNNELVGRLREENNVLQMQEAYQDNYGEENQQHNPKHFPTDGEWVLKHQQVIEALIEENEKLRRVIVQELKVPANKLQTSNIAGMNSHIPCSDCFECRRRQRKLR